MAMKFKTELLKELLNAIEYRISFSVDGFKETQCFDLKCNINIEEVFNTLNKTSKRYEIDELKYCIALLKQFGYIEISEDSIKQVTANGFKFMTYVLYGIDCKY